MTINELFDVTLDELLNASALVFGAGIKGVADGLEIELGNLDYALPAVSILTLPITKRFSEGPGNMIDNTVYAATFATATYVISRGLTTLSKNL
ncbi:hypothetical protein GOV11_04420 [Candidatus Woesearchaeota archaeon]|nr:hypothetical protein [Candidatus Woesearchaeota archaeon]